MASGGSLGVARSAVKIVALVVGLLGTLVCLQALVGKFTASGWLRGGAALVIALVVPAVVADRLLPDDDPAKGKGVVGDVFAVLWLAVPVLFALVLGGATNGLLRTEGDRLTQAGFGSLGRVAYLLGGVDTTVTVTHEGSSSASGSAATSGAPPVVGSGSAGGEAIPKPEDAGAPTPKPKQPGEKTPAELFKELAPSVVSINIKAGPEMEGGGTGFLVDTKGTIVTNHHVIAVGKEIRIKFFNGAIYEEVDVLEEDPGQDLALLAIKLSKPKEGKAPKIDPPGLGNSDKVQVGERAISIGNPLGLEHTLTDGLVSARRVYQGKHWIQMSVPVSPGNSGGPVFDLKGNVIGVTTAQVLGGFFGRAQNLNLAIPVNEVKKRLRSQYPNRRKFGTQGGGSHW
jgi:S1-C subfamily serine protease